MHPFGLTFFRVAITFQCASDCAYADPQGALVRFSIFPFLEFFRPIIFGVIPQYQNKGVYSIMIMKMYEVMHKDPYIQSTELAWIGDFNPKMHSLFESLKAEKVKIHHTFRKLY